MSLSVLFSTYLLVAQVGETPMPAVETAPRRSYEFDAMPVDRAPTDRFADGNEPAATSGAAAAEPSYVRPAAGGFDTGGRYGTPAPLQTDPLPNAPSNSSRAGNSFGGYTTPGSAPAGSSRTTWPESNPAANSLPARPAASPVGSMARPTGGTAPPPLADPNAPLSNPSSGWSNPSDRTPLGGTTSAGTLPGAGPAAGVSIQPTSRPISAVQPSTDSPEVRLVRDLVNGLFQSPSSAAPVGEPLSLRAALQTTDGNLGAVDAYWKLAIAQCDYHAATADRARLSGWRSNDADAQLAQQEAAARLADAQADLVGAQHDLRRQARNLQSTTKLVIAADAPHAGPYTLNFDRIFPSVGSAPGGALRGRDVIPVRYAAVIAPKTLNAAENRLRQLEMSPTSGSQLATSWTTMRKARAAFLRSLYIYNIEIANYALAVPGVSNRDVLAGILIKKEVQAAAPRPALGTTSDAAVDSGVRPASAELEAPAESAMLQPEPDPAADEPAALPASDVPSRLAPAPSFATPAAGSAPQESPAATFPATAPANNRFVPMEQRVLDNEPIPAPADRFAPAAGGIGAPSLTPADDGIRSPLR